MPRSVYSAVGRGGPSRFNPINLGKRFAVSVLAASLGLLGMAATQAGASTVTAVGFTPASVVVNATSTWTIGYTQTTAFVAGSGNTITAVLPAGFTVPATPAVTLSAAFTGTGCAATAANTVTTFNTVVVSLGSTCAVTATATPTFTIAGITNPATPQAFANTTFSVQTSVDNSSAVNPSTGISITGAMAAPTAVGGGLDATGATPVGYAYVTLKADSADTGIYVITAYDVTTGAPVSAGTTNTAGSVAAGASYTQEVSGLTVGDSYEFTVTPPAASTLFTVSTYSSPIVIGTALAQPTAAVSASGTVNVTFQGDGAATTYTVNTLVYNPSTGGTTAAPNTCTYTTASPLTVDTTAFCTVTGLTNGNSYEFTVTPSGNSTPSTVSPASAPVKVAATLATPTATSAGATGSPASPAVNVSFTADGIAALYTVTTTAAGTPVALATCTVGNSATPLTGAQSCTITAGLTANTAYVFTVTPSGNGDSTLAASTASFTTPLANALGAPTAVVSGPDQMTVSFATDGVATLYTVGSKDAGTNATVATACYVSSATPLSGTQSCVVTGLTSGHGYVFQVTPAGGGTVSTVSAYSSPAVTATDAMATPTVATAGAQAVKVSFTADGNAWEYVVSTYVMPADTLVAADTCVVANSTTAPTGAQSCTVTGLSNATTYRFLVTPYYAGTFTGTPSTASAQSAGVTTVSPIVITSAAATGSGAVTVTFTPDGVATTYLVNSYVGTSTTPAAQTCTVVSATAIATAPNQSCTVTGLSNGTAYTFTVTPSGNSTTSAMSAPSASVTPGTGLATPTVVDAGSGAVTVTFVADGVATLYTVQSTGTYVSPGHNPAINGSCVVANTATPPTGSQSCTVTGLSNFDSYTFTVTPSGNSTTSSASGPSVAITPTSALAKPTVTNAGSGAILVSFAADGTASTYTVNTYVMPANTLVTGASCVVINTTTAPKGAQSCTVSGLTNGQTYTFTVNPTGNSTQSTVSPASSAIMAGTTFLATPTVAWAGSGAAAVSFTADGVASTYVVTASTTSTATGIVTTGSCTVANSTTAPKGAQSCTVSGLSNGTTYTFVVTPSGNGTTSLPSAPSAPFTVTASVVPSAATAVTTTATANSITVNWTAPTNTGNSALTGYVVTATAANTTVSCGTVAGTATSCTITGLSASTVYVVSVSAVNAIGTSAAATASATTLAAPAAKNPYTTGTHGVAYAGRTVTLTISGGNFYGQPRITSNVAGTRVGVKGDTGSLLTIIVTTPANAAKGWHTFTITLANGKVCRANYNVK